MTIEIKGLGSVVAQARKAINDVREQSAGLRDDTAALAVTLREVRKAVNQAHDDLKFEAETLKNSPSEAASALMADWMDTQEKAEPMVISPPAKPLGGYETANTVNK